MEKTTTTYSTKISNFIQYDIQISIMSKEIDSDLFKLEPLDIHLEIDLT